MLFFNSRLPLTQAAICISSDSSDLWNLCDFRKQSVMVWVKAPSSASVSKELTSSVFTAETKKGRFLGRMFLRDVGTLPDYTVS